MATLLLIVLAAAQEARGDSVLLVSMDGMRWQELFTGAEKDLINPKDDETRKQFWRAKPEERREAMMPFLWGTIAKEGQIYGNRAKGSHATITNGLKFSYPGYSEFLCGFPDGTIDSNDKKPNPNVTVLEWISKRPGFARSVAAFGTWDVLPYILNRERSGLHILAAEEPIVDEPLTERQKTINDLLRDMEGVPWEGNSLDIFMFHAALEHLKRHKPRVLYIQLGETDEWAHAGNYDRYLRSARRSDRFLKMLWETVQAMPEYKGRVSLLVTTDHGRGDGSKWTDHGRSTGGAENIWIAMMGPKVRPLGERSKVDPVTQSQVAATLAALVGEDYAGAVPKAAKPIAFER
jgi:hypothetical protein